MTIYSTRHALGLLNLRYRLARIRVYIEQGAYLLQTPLRLLGYGSIAFYVLNERGVLHNRWFLVAIVPCGLAVFYAVGVWWTRHGWQRQEVDVSLVENMSRQARVAAVQQVRIMAALDELLRRSGSPRRCEYNHIPEMLPEEVIEVLASAKRRDA